MQTFSSVQELKNVSDNTVYIPDSVIMKNCVITFNGSNNILVIEDGVNLFDCKIKMNASNSVVYIAKNKHIVRLNIDIYNNSVFYVGENNYMNGVLNVTVSEQKNVVIGNDNLFAFGIWLRTADPHLVYSTKTKKRINPSKSIFLGDHIWVGQNVFVLKGTKMHSGSILGAGAVCSGKELASNSSFAGNPVKLIGEDIFWDKACVHGWDDEKTEKNEFFKSDKFIFKYNEKEYISFDKIDSELTLLKSSKEKFDYIKLIRENKNKNRFAYFQAQPSKKGLFKRK